MSARARIIRRGTPESFGWMKVTKPECRKLGCRLDVWERPNGELHLQDPAKPFEVIRTARF